MALNYAYIFAYIDLEDNCCIGIETTTNPEQGEDPAYVQIPVYDEEYLFKYYIDGAWYEDAEGTIPWESSLI